ncbi:MAG: hypothetical protein ABI878_11815 [Acidobacteriota bacterium]
MKPSTESAVTQESSVDEDLDELERAMWSVISFEKREASGLIYKEAFRKLDELEKKGIAGLCIVTDTAALKVPAEK